MHDLGSNIDTDRVDNVNIPLYDAMGFFASDEAPPAAFFLSESRRGRLLLPLGCRARGSSQKDEDEVNEVDKDANRVETSTTLACCGRVNTGPRKTSSQLSSAALELGPRTTVYFYARMPTPLRFYHKARQRKIVTAGHGIIGHVTRHNRRQA
ncbi:hypothetical protein AC578_10558 [Pseudocercospora eumusae]|uniref:Uncharacterized protein n=1 Tax=Pseudocercospora eumusae TaxID=321146 RepID=A0A139H5I1_9PEZI|nr:hypothetical protein AC578_10558 [Pseudocercospora eumusae]